MSTAPGAPPSSSAGRSAWPGRVALLVVALLGVAWLAANLRANDLQEQASVELAKANGPRGEVAKREARRDFDRARRFNDDTSPLLAEAAGRVINGDVAGGARITAQLVRREPDNFDAWNLRFAALRKTDPAEAPKARARLVAIDPLIRSRLPR